MKTRTMIAALLLSALAVVAGRAQDVDSLWSSAVDEYTDGNYQAALDGFSAIEQAGYVSPDLYYNMGNCCYKLGHRLGQLHPVLREGPETGPFVRGCRVNLEMPREYTLDRIEFRTGIPSSLRGSGNSGIPFHPMPGPG